MRGRAVECGVASGPNQRSAPFPLCDRLADDDVVVHRECPERIRDSTIAAFILDVPRGSAPVGLPQRTGLIVPRMDGGRASLQGARLTTSGPADRAYG